MNSLVLVWFACYVGCFGFTGVRWLGWFVIGCVLWGVFWCAFVQLCSCVNSVDILRIGLC